MSRAWREDSTNCSTTGRRVRMRVQPPPAGDVAQHEAGSSLVEVALQPVAQRLGLPAIDLERLGEHRGRERFVGDEEQGLEGAGLMTPCLLGSVAIAHRTLDLNPSTRPRYHRTSRLVRARPFLHGTARGWPGIAPPRGSARRSRPPGRGTSRPRPISVIRSSSVVIASATVYRTGVTWERSRVGGGRSSAAAIVASCSGRRCVHRVGVQVRELRSGSDVAREVPGLVLEPARDLERDLAERRELERSRVGEVGRPAQQVLFVELRVLRGEAGHLELQQHGADREEPRGLLEVPAVGVLRVGEVAIGHAWRPRRRRRRPSARGSARRASGTDP